MTNKEILEKATGIAIAGGLDEDMGLDIIKQLREIAKKYGDFIDLGSKAFIRGIIFDHDFARALWGNEILVGDRLTDGNEAWRFHLMHMVIANDPIKYLGDNI